MRIVNIPARRLPQTKLTRYRAAMRPGFALRSLPALRSPPAGSLDSAKGGPN
jgi:hypothetical protein